MLAIPPFVLQLVDGCLVVVAGLMDEDTDILLPEGAVADLIFEHEGTHSAACARTAMRGGAPILHQNVNHATLNTEQEVPDDSNDNARND